MDCMAGGVAEAFNFFQLPGSNKKIPFDFIHPEDEKNLIEVAYKKRHSAGDVQLAIHAAYNDSFDGKLTLKERLFLSRGFNISEEDVMRKFRNCRNYQEKKAKKALITHRVMSVDSPAIDEIAVEMDLNNRRIKECFVKNKEAIIAAVEKAGTFVDKASRSILCHA